MEFYAGYGDNLPLAFVGNITVAWSVREGNNFITNIDCFDGGFAYVNAITDQQFPTNTKQQAIVDSLCESLSAFGVTKGANSDFDGNISRGNSYSGSTCDLLGEITGDAFFIDNGKVYCLKDGDAIEAPTLIISPKSGLLNTPVREALYVNIEMLFEPNVKIAQVAELQSETDSFFNGEYKVITIQHRGIISEAVSGDAFTNIGLLPGTFNFVSAAPNG